jgi:integrase
MHVRQLSSGSWRWIVQHRGVKRNGTSPTRARAILDGSRALVELGADHPAKIRATVDELLVAWQAEHEAEWSPTYAADVRHVCGHLPPAFLARDIGTVEPAVIATLQRTLTKQGWSAHRIQRVRGCLSGAYGMAVTYGWAQRNPVRDVNPPTVEQSDVHAPNDYSVRLLLESVPDRIRLVLWLAAVTGCRLGELVALRWADLDGGTLTVRRAVVYTPATGTVIREKTKTGRKGDRRLDLDDDTLAMLIAHRDNQRINAEERRLPVPVYVFSHDGGVSPWRPGYVGLAFRRARAGVPGATAVRFHDLRHYVATTMLADGEPLIDVAAQLGHSTPATTARVYAHYLPGRGKESATKRAGRLGPRRPNG